MDVTTEQWTRLLQEAGAILSAVFDPKPIGFRHQDEVGIRPVRNGCIKPDSNLHLFRNPLNRNAFLVGCLDFTEHATIEHLIVGLGYENGSTTKIVALLHTAGAAASVAVTPEIEMAMDRHFSSGYHAAVILFHNHPRNAIHTIFDNSPLASHADRRWLIAKFLKPEVVLKAVAGGGRIRCYIGENGFVREFLPQNLVGFQ